jgi:hypothetical protein
MTQDEIIEMAKQAGFGNYTYEALSMFETFAKLVAQHERERIKQANAPEIERVNAHITQLEDAVLAERKACFYLVKNYIKETDNMEARGCLASVAYDIKARGQA